MMDTRVKPAYDVRYLWDGPKKCWCLVGSLRCYTRDYVSAEDADMPGYNAFTRRDGPIRHFWGGEMGGATADPGQDPRGAPDFDPLWTLLDTTPEGRGKDWYPKLGY
jgi:predicted dithiol-disulfide oxidoreductase (DUF899 family)